jgi:aldose 1-epimerase
MSHSPFLDLTDATGARATVAPKLGGWLLRYARPVPNHGLVDALHFDPAVVERYPRDLWAGNPLLFPLVSFNHRPGREHHYAWEGREYALPQHGFARRLPWNVVEQTESGLTMELTDSEATRAAYPFAFRQRVHYRLREGRLHFEQVVENRGETPMPFCTGIHPYFRVPLRDGGRRNDCFVELPDCARYVPEASWTRWATRPQPAGRLSVGEDAAGTIFLGDFQQRELQLVDPHAGLEIVLNWEDAPQHRWCALWSRTTEAPFYCLEPWTALPNAFTRAHPGEVRVLPPRGTFRAAMWMDVVER